MIETLISKKRNDVMFIENIAYIHKTEINKKKGVVDFLRFIHAYFQIYVIDIAMYRLN